MTVKVGSLLQACTHVSAYTSSNYIRFAGIIEPEDPIVVLSIFDKVSHRAWTDEPGISGSVLWNGSIVYTFLGSDPEDHRRFKPI